LKSPFPTQNGKDFSPENYSHETSLYPTGMKEETKEENISKIWKVH